MAPLTFIKPLTINLSRSDTFVFVTARHDFNHLSQTISNVFEVIFWDGYNCGEKHKMKITNLGYVVVR